MPKVVAPTPGMRVLCRDAEWLVTRVDPSDHSHQNYAVHCIGADDLVRGHEAIFLTQLDTIEPVDPRNTQLVRDQSSGYRLAKLFLEAQLRQMPATGVEPDLKGMGAFKPMNFQVQTVAWALRQLRPRLLLADAVGLGKTIQVGMILSELMRRGRANRVLVLAKKSMLTQFQSELWNRFGIPLVRLDSAGIAKLRLRIPANKNPFEVYHRVIISIDTLIRRAVLRESVLLRLLPDKQDRDEAGWGELLVQSFFSPLPQQQESMADRVTVFLEDLMAASGSITDPDSARFALYDATRLRDQQFVALVSGKSDQQSRERVFSGFNTPLLPEVLICTSVGQEGIDLHRHCRHVVHFDLAWNPAVLEQRTGRADRIGSKTFRERALSNGPTSSFLEIGVPYLAGTYDERMYEELRLRSQTFEVLTGGDLAADDADGLDDDKKAEGQESGLRFVALPDEMVNQMRVSLHVWEEGKVRL